MKKNNPSSTKRLDEIRTKVESLITKNRKEVGSGKSISEIENGLLSDILEIGKLLLEDRVIEEEEKMEDKSYEIEGKKNK